MTPEEFLQTWQNHPSEQIRQALEPWLQDRLDASGEHLAWSSACEELGYHDLAFREAQLAVRDEPDNPSTLRQLANMLLERGNSDRAARHLEKLFSLAPQDHETLATLIEIYTDQDRRDRLAELLPLAGKQSKRGTEPDWGAPEEDPVPDEADAIRFLSFFSGREDTHARQWYSKDGRGGYTPVQSPLTPREIRNHLAGNVTLGVYCIRVDSTVQFMAVDIDLRKSALEEARGQPERARELRAILKEVTVSLTDSLKTLGFPCAIEDSGYKGRHLWVFFDKPEPAEVVHNFGRLFLQKVAPTLPPEIHLEFFPKQAGRRTDKGLGNLIKLPLGIHRKTGRRSRFMTLDGDWVPDWQAYLHRIPRSPSEMLFGAVEKLKQESWLPLSEETKTEDLSTGPAPPLPAPAWTEADYTAYPRIHHLLSHCPVLQALKQKVDEYQLLERDEQLILTHTLGHLPEGVLAVNHLFSRCGNVPKEQYLQSVLAGNPMSCPKIRKRIPHVTSKVACNCSFSWAPERYPTPTLHLLPMGESQPPLLAPSSDLETLARRYATLGRRLEELKQEHVTLANALAEQINQIPDRCLVLPEGRFVLQSEDTVETLLWEPTPSNGA